VSVKGLDPDPKKVVVEGFPIPKFVTNVRTFLGLTRYYKRFVPRYVKIVKPLFNLTKKDCKFVWTPIYQGAFVTLKKRLMESHVWTRPDFSQAFILDVDWSIKGVGAILSQKLEKHEQSIVPHT
jgi:hypothetical protein